MSEQKSQRAPEAVTPVPPEGKAPFYVYEIFIQRNHDSHHEHVYSLLAPDDQMALVLAKENFLRREEACINIWAVRRDHVVATPYDDPDFFARTTDRSYRNPAGYRQNMYKWRKYKIQANAGHDEGEHAHG
jgi:ring-1,2-phenylacetyl-CoA epoxidase subunit PaaB